MIKKLIYGLRYLNELRAFGKNKNIHALPEIFHYWSNTYLLPKLQRFGFNSPDSFFYKYCIETCSELKDKSLIKIISIGSGNGELEVNIAKQLVESGIKNFTVECMDMNAKMHKRTRSLAEEEGVSSYITILKCDFNAWQSDERYDIVVANQSLHHVTNLEGLFDTIYRCLTPEGKFITSDMIGRNGHMRWPEALEIVNELWQELPQQYKCNQFSKKDEINYINYDCAVRSFEGVRAQDILPLLVDKFEFELFLPFANIIMVFIDRKFGHNYDIGSDVDKERIDRIHRLDEAAILDGTIKPTQMLAVMTKSTVPETILIDPILTPEFCIRDPSI